MRRPGTNEESVERGAREEAISFSSLEDAHLTAVKAAELAALAIHEVVVAVGRASIAVRFSRASAAAAFADRFGDMLARAAPNATVYAVAVRGRAYFWRFAERARCWPRDLDDELYVFFADNVAFHDYLVASDDLGLHAAVLVRASRAAAVVGRSTAGKTTTALAMIDQAFQLYSDERCIIQAGKVVPFLRAMTIRPGGRAALLHGVAPGNTVVEGLRAFPAGSEVVIRPRALVGDRAGGSATPLGSVFCIEGRQTEPCVRTAPSYALLPVLLKSMTSRESGVDRLARLLRELGNVSFFQVWLGTPAATARALSEAFEDAGRSANDRHR